MNESKKQLQKVVFNELPDDPRPKVLFGYVTDKGDFIEVITTQNKTFVINKKFLIFTREGGY